MQKEIKIVFTIFLINAIKICKGVIFMRKLTNGHFTGERALYMVEDLAVNDSIFESGESPLKECKNIEVINSEFRYKYPLWYTNGIKVINSKLYPLSRSGLWYSNDIYFENNHIEAPKLFRRCNNIVIKNCDILDGLETFWNSKNIELDNVKAIGNEFIFFCHNLKINNSNLNTNHGLHACSVIDINNSTISGNHCLNVACSVNINNSTLNGDYFALNSHNIKLNNVTINGNYAFDGGKDIEINNCILNSKDSFWNTENVVVKDSKIVGEYLGWNSKNLTLINCEISSNQGLCYIDNVTLVNCKLKDTDLCFEFCKNIDAKIEGDIVSIKNPISGKIKANHIGKLILDNKLIKETDTVIEVLE